MDYYHDLNDFLEWLNSDEKISFVNAESNSFLILPGGVIEQRDFQGNRYEFSMYNNIISIRPLLKSGPIPYRVTLTFRISGKEYTNTWNSSEVSAYFKVVVDSRLAVTLEILKWEQPKCMYLLYFQDKLITKIYSVPSYVLESIQNYNNYKKTRYTVHDLKIIIEN